MINDEKKLYIIEAREYSVYATYEVWAASEEEADDILDPNIHQVDSDSDDCFEVLSIREATKEEIEDSTVDPD